MKENKKVPQLLYPHSHELSEIRSVGLPISKDDNYGEGNLNYVPIKFNKQDDWENFVDLKKEIIELRIHQQYLQSVVDEKTKELNNEVESRGRLESELTKLERLNVIGQLAASLGHEVRNPLTTIRGFLQLLQNKKEIQTYKSYLDLMIEELDRCTEIIHNYLSLTKDKPAALNLTSLNDVLKNLFPLLQSDAYNQGKQAFLELGDINELNIDPNEITQLVLNLARNGLEAMSAEGCLWIGTFTEDSEIVLSIRDEGKGIDPEDIPKIGTPFFTTKDNGTGLGLLTCYRIVDRHRAKIDITTGPSGTNFLVRFPCIIEWMEDASK